MEEFLNKNLIEKSIKGDTEIVNFLLKSGADINHQDYFQYTALMRASENGHLEIAKLLLEYGADVNSSKQIPKYSFNVC